MSNDNNDNAQDGQATPQPTVAAFSPNQQTAARDRSKSSILIHQKTQLLISTPPEVTRQLAQSHPYILPLNQLAGLLAWKTDDPWESFLLLASFWFVLLYGDHVLRWAGPLVLVVGLILGMYSRRYSPLSSTVWSGMKKQNRQRAVSESRKTLEDIVGTLQQFSERCEILLDPFVRLTEFLSTQSGPTSATTRHSLTTLFLRILGLTPIWIGLTVWPVPLITARHVILTMGTIGLSWHCQVARVCRTILWRSRMIRNGVSLLTGLEFTRQTTSNAQDPPPGLQPRSQAAAANALKTKTKDRPKGASREIRFTFAIYENQRRWIFLGWNDSMLATERQHWTDEYSHPCPQPDQYELPDTENTTTRWRWVKGSEWSVEGAKTENEKSAKRIGGGGGGDESGWVYCDNYWADPRKLDGFSRYTRRRKWTRDAELVDVGAEEDAPKTPGESGSGTVAEKGGAETSSIDSAAAKKKGWFGGASGETPTSRKKLPRRQSELRKSVDKAEVASATGSAGSTRSRESVDDDVHTPIERLRQHDWDRSINEGLASGLS